MNKKYKILVSGGGTGGHIFPAIAIANELKERLNNAEIQFVGAKGKMEMEKVPMAGYEITGLNISGIQRKLTFKNLSFPFKVISSYLRSLSIIRKFKPDICIGTGGYASAPLLFAASGKKIPTLIHEQNAFPGITNKLLSKKASVVCVSYPGMEKYFPKDKIVVTGNPIRKQILNNDVTQEEARKFFNIDKNKPTLLIIGGSQGAKKINDAVAQNIESILALGIQIIWQTGEISFESLKSSLPERNEISLHKFIQKMEMAYSACDFIISRAGAIAIAEIISSSKPAIFVPLPSAAEDHQTKNAMSLVDGNAGLIVKESEINNEILPELEKLSFSKELQANIINNLKKFNHPKASEKIADQVIKLIADES
jgi:UDP-N-acetylglucosamine--N-acetylmuramyl-(pentapeptide) pyrophosphoryl-undecaprenol N-acetylglucosamine transferase